MIILKFGKHGVTLLNITI